VQSLDAKDRRKMVGTLRYCLSDISAEMRSREGREAEVYSVTFIDTYGIIEK
jgi:hypothetical protein